MDMGCSRETITSQADNISLRSPGKTQLVVKPNYFDFIVCNIHGEQPGTYGSTQILPSFTLTGIYTNSLEMHRLLCIYNSVVKTKILQTVSTEPSTSLAVCCPVKRYFVQSHDDLTMWSVVIITISEETTVKSNYSIINERIRLCLIIIIPNFDLISKQIL